MPWRISMPFRRILQLIGLASAGIGIFAFLVVTYPQWDLGMRISEGIKTVGTWWSLLPDWGIGPVRLGHGILAGIGVVLFVFFFYQFPSPEDKSAGKMERAQAELRQGQAELRQEQRELSRKVLDALSPAQAEPVSFSKTEFVNAPIGEVWQFLTETNCGPTCRELLPDVEVTKKGKGVINWQGKGTVADEEIFVEGSTRLTAPTGFTVSCESGALKGFEASFLLTRAGNRTEVEQQAEFDVNSIPSEFSPLAQKLSVLVPHILKGDLNRIREHLERS